jgi:hypothetical protein
MAAPTPDRRYVHPGERTVRGRSRQLSSAANRMGMHAMNDSTAQFEMLIQELERQMSDLQLRHGDVFALANAWAERYDAIVAVTPQALQADVEARLSRIGIRWGMMPGARVTSEFRALDRQMPQSERVRMLSRGMLSKDMLPKNVLSENAQPAGAPTQDSQAVPVDEVDESPSS